MSVFIASHERFHERLDSMATTTVTVTVPDGVYAGDGFVIEFDGQQLSVTCPDGCGPGDAINLEVPAGDGSGGGGSGLRKWWR